MDIIDSVVQNLNGGELLKITKLAFWVCGANIIFVPLNSHLHYLSKYNKLIDTDNKDKINK
jgi:hypothetical protein